MTTTQPDFSVLTPTFQAERYIEQCARSVLDQGISVEHLIQDGASTDRTVEIARRLGTSVQTQPDRGMYDALNSALQRSVGRFLVQLNADEQFLPGALQMARELLDGFDNPTVLSGDVIIMNDRLEAIAYRRAVRPRRLYSPYATVSTAATFYPRSLLEDGLLDFDPSYRDTGDADLIRRLVKVRVRWKAVPIPFAAFLVTGENRSRGRDARVEEQRWFRQHGPTARVRSRLAQTFYRAEKAVRGGYRRHAVDTALYEAHSTERRAVVAAKLGWRWHWQ
jgi:glycosyltransferase involved in cell wall biosynthesis